MIEEDAEVIRAVIARDGGDAGVGERGGARAYDLPSSGDLRVGERVRIENGQLFRN